MPNRISHDTVCVDQDLLVGDISRAEGGGSNRVHVNKTQGGFVGNSSELRVLYVNINGQTKKLWDEIVVRVNQSDADIVALSETHWQEGHPGKHLVGFKRFVCQRSILDKKGGGIAVFVRNSISSYEWVANDLPGNRELLWVILQSKNREVALGTVYMAVDQACELNQEIEERLVSDVSVHSAAHRIILLQGDFNGHIEERDGGITGYKHKANRNGQRVLKLAAEQNLSILNFSEKCSGKWTRMRAGQQPSIIDYVLVDQNSEHLIKSVHIDDQGRGLADTTDHSWIQTCIEVGGLVISSKKEETCHWKIRDDTDWTPFRSKLSERLALWSLETAKAGSSEEVAEISYNKLIDIIQKTGEECIGWGPTKTLKNKSLNRRLKKAVMTRNKLGRKWRRAVGRDKLSADRWWVKYKSKKTLVNNLKKKAELKSNKKWVMQTLLNGDVNAVWNKLGPHGIGSSLDALMINDKAVSDQSIIKIEVEKYFRKLGTVDENHGQDTGTTETGKFDHPFRKKFLVRRWSKLSKTLKMERRWVWIESQTNFLSRGGLLWCRL